MTVIDPNPTPSPKYRRWYDAIITAARNRQIGGYVERHHVLPRCIGGSDDDSNMVTLTYREHFLAHWLLVKFTEGLAKRKMQHALTRMGHTHAQRRRIVAGWQYEIAKRARRDAMKGKKFSHEHRAKLSAFQKGRVRKFSLERNAKISAAHKGKKLSPEHCAKMSAALKGRKLSPERIAKMEGMRGKKLSLEQRAKISAALKGRKHSPEQRAKISAALKGRKHSPEHIAKWSAAIKGRKLSPEYIAKMKGWKFSPEQRARVSAGVRAAYAAKAARSASLKQGEPL